MGKLFICYRRDDTTHFAGRIVDQLTQSLRSSDVFIDNNGVRAGTRWQETLGRALSAADCVLVVIGSRWLTLERDGRRRIEHEDDWVRAEIRTALQSGKRLIPILEEGTQLPEKRDLPEDIHGLLDWQAHRLRSGHFANDCKELLELIQEGSEPVPSASVGTARASRPRPWLAVIVVALLILAVWIAMSGSSKPPKPPPVPAPSHSVSAAPKPEPTPQLPVSHFELSGEPSCVNGGVLKVTFLDVGQGDAALFQLGKTDVLVDVGEASAETVAALQKAIVSPLEYLFISHAHMDHYGAAALLLQKVHVEQAFLGAPAKTRGWEMMMNELKKQGTEIERPTQGQQLDLGAGFSMTILSAGDGDPQWSVNNQSIVQRFDYCGRRILMTGDIEPQAEEWLIEKYCSKGACPELRADVLKFPWHGSDHFSKAFLDAVHPSQAVISAGPMSRYHVPSASTIEVLKELGVQIFSTSGEELQNIELRVTGGSGAGFPCYDREQKVWKRCSN